MWTAPPPAWNQTIQGTDPANIQTAVIKVPNGTTNYHVRWNYTLLAGQSISLIFFNIDDGVNPQDVVGFVVQGGSSRVYDRYEYSTRFSIGGTKEFSTLTINKVTERENATFQCRISLTAGTSWAYNIRIHVTGMVKSAQALNELNKLSVLAANDEDKNYEVTVSQSTKTVPGIQGVS